MIRGPGMPVRRALSQVAAGTRVWFNPDLRSRNYFVPGVVANILLMVTLMLTAQAIVREKEIGTMEQLMVTPVRPIELMLGKTLPFALVGMVNMVIVTVAALLIFHIPFRGNFLLLMFCAVLFLMTTLGAGLFLSTISHTQQQAKMGVVLLHHAGVHAERLRFPDPQHAGGRAVPDLPQPAALFHGDRARRVPQGRGRSRALAADAGAGRVRRHRPDLKRGALP